MAIAAVGSASLDSLISTYASGTASAKAWSAVGTALDSGNLTAASSAFKIYSNLNSGISEGSSTLAKSMSSLSDALSTGSLSDAKTAYATAAEALSKDPAQTILAAQEAASASVAWIEDTINLSSLFTSSSSSTSLAEMMANVLSGVYGNGSAMGDSTTSILSSAFGQTLSGTDGASNVLSSVYGTQASNVETAAEKAIAARSGSSS